MASIKDAVEESFSDNHAFIKYFLFAIPLYITYVLYESDNTGFIFWLFAIFTFLLMLGTLTICTTNVRHNKNQIFPGLNIFKIISQALRTLMAIGPTMLVNLWLASFITSKFTLPNPGVDTAFKIIIWCVFSSVIFTGYLLYVKDLKIKDAYNLKAISDYGADIMMAVIFMIPLVLLSNAIFLGSITYIFVLFFGIPNPVWLFICAMFVFQNISVIGNYLAQIAMENIEIKLEMEKHDRGETSI